MMTAVLIMAEEAMVEIAEELGEIDFSLRARSRAIRLRLGLHALWDEKSGRYGFLDNRQQYLQSPDVLAAYMPLVLEQDPHRRSLLLENLSARYLTPTPLPSTAPTDPGFVPQSYWRGPVWWCQAWLLLPSLPARLQEVIKRRLLDCVEEAGFWEYFHPLTGEGLGSPSFTWTAALTLDWLMDG